MAQPGSITGSIGVAFGKLEASQALQDQGINVDTVAVGKNATTSSLFHDFTKEQRRQVNTMMDRYAAACTMFDNHAVVFAQVFCPAWPQALQAVMHD